MRERRPLEWTVGHTKGPDSAPARFVPATPGGIMQMLDRAGIEIQGQNAVIIGRSEIVGKPMASLLMHRHATITVCHSRTQDLPGVCSRADILIVALPVAGLLWLTARPGLAAGRVGAVPGLLHRLMKGLAVAFAGIYGLGLAMMFLG